MNSQDYSPVGAATQPAHLSAIYLDNQQGWKGNNIVFTNLQNSPYDAYRSTFV